MKKRETKQQRFTRKVLKTKEEFLLDDDQMNEWVVPEVERRSKDYMIAVAKKYGKSIAKDVIKWWMDLSPLERAQTHAENAEEIYQSYMVNKDSKKITSKVIKKAKNPIHDPRWDELGPPEMDDNYRVRPGKKMDLKKPPPREPTAAELKKMSQKEIADLIVQIRDYKWPSGGGDAEVPGIEGVGVEK